jgi:hypothetical protein
VQDNVVLSLINGSNDYFVFFFNCPKKICECSSEDILVDTHAAINVMGNIIFKWKSNRKKFFNQKQNTLEQSLWNNCKTKTLASLNKHQQLQGSVYQSSTNTAFHKNASQAHTQQTLMCERQSLDNTMS